MPATLDKLGTQFNCRVDQVNMPFKMLNYPGTLKTPWDPSKRVGYCTRSRVSLSHLPIPSHVYRHYITFVVDMPLNLIHPSINPSFSPIYPEEEMDEENIIDDDAELDLNKVEDEMMQVTT